MSLYPGVFPPQLTGHRGSPGGVEVPRALGFDLWWSADSGHDQSSTIASWRDCIAGLDLTASGAGRPSYDPVGCGGRPAVSFDGIAEFMSAAGGPATDAGTGLAVYAILESASAVSDAAIVGRWDPVAANSLWLMQLHAGAATSTGSANISETGTNTNRFSIRTGTNNASDDPSSGAGNARGNLLLWDGATVTRYTGQSAGSGTACAGAKTRDATPMEVGRLNGTIFTAMGLRHLMIRRGTLTVADYARLGAWALVDCGVP